MNNIVSTVLTISIKSSVLFLVFLLLRSTMRKRINPLVVSRTWLILFILTCMPFNITSDYSWEKIVPGREVTQQIKTIPNQIGQVTYTLPQLDRGLPKRKVNVSLIVYMIGLIVMFLFFAIQHERLRRSKKTISQLSHDYKTLVGYRGSVSVATTKYLSSPAVMGFLRPNIYLPEKMIEHLSLKEMKHVFIHELCHLKARDHWYNYLILAYKIIFWFNPLTHYFFRIIKEDMEYACDYRVKAVLDKDEWKLYGHTLLNLASLTTDKKQYIVAPLAENKHALRKRIEQLISTKKHSKLLIIVMVAALTLVGCVIFTKSSDETPDIIETSSPIETANETKELTIDIAKALIESQRVEQLENYQLFMRTEYLNESGESLGWTTVYPISSSEENSALYMETKGHDVSLYIDEFNGTMATVLMDSEYVVQYASTQTSVDIETLYEKNYTDINKAIEENDLTNQYIRFIQRKSSPKKEVYLIVNDNKGVAYLTEDKQVLGSRLIDLNSYTLDLQTLFWDNFYDEGARTFDYDHFINETIPLVKAYFPVEDDLSINIHPVEMDNFFIVFLDNGMSVRVLKETGELFLIQNVYDDSEEHSESLSLELSIEAVETFIESTPMKDWLLTLDGISSENQFDMNEVEYYVFTFKKPNEETVYIKYNTYYCLIDSLWY